MEANTDKKDVPLYSEPPFPAPTPSRIKSLSESLGLGSLSDEEAAGYSHHMSKSLEAYHRLDSLTHLLPRLPVTTPRLPGDPPSPEENKLGAWVWRCDIKSTSPSTTLLDGKTVAIKDNIAVAGIPMSNGSYILRGYIPEGDATVVTRILENGGKITGKAKCENLCFSGNSFTSVGGPVKNPHNQLYTSGGSSSGSAALVASKEVDMAIGGDQGGSVRIPASFCGVVGLKPTWSLVPYTGAMTIEPTLDHLGPITRSVQDCARLLEAIAGYDQGYDHRQHPHIKASQYLTNLSSECKGLKIAALYEGFDVSKPDVQAVVREALNKLKSFGATVDEVSIPLHREGPAIFMAVAGEGTKDSMITSNGVGSGHKGFYSTSLNDWLARAYKTNPEKMSATVKLITLLGSYADKYHSKHYYCLGQNLVYPLRAAYDKVLQKYDVIIMPTIPVPPMKLPSAGLSTSDYLTEAIGEIILNTCPFDLTGHPALTINAGTVAAAEGDGRLPVGLMIVGRSFDEQTVLNVAAAYEKIRDS